MPPKAPIRGIFAFPSVFLPEGRKEKTISCMEAKATVIPKRHIDKQEIPLKELW